MSEELDLDKLKEIVSEKIMEKHLQNENVKAEVAKIKLTKEKTQITDSKVAGLPYVPIGKEVPKAKNGKAMRLLAQIKCEDLKGLKNFPKEGILQIFVLDNDTMGIDWDEQTNQDNFRVVYYDKMEDFYDEEQLNEIYKPYVEKNGEFDSNIPYAYKMTVNLNEQVKMIDYDDLLDYFETVCDELKLSISEDEKYDLEDEILKLFGNVEYGNHQCGGFALYNQGSPAEMNENYKKFDTLLFQLDSEDPREICFGDMGTLHFLINEEDLKNKNFEKILYNMDCG